MKTSKLAAYSAAAVSFIFYTPDTDAQVIYADIDPDVHIGNIDPVSIDLNGDGINELKFSRYHFFTFSSFESDIWGYSLNIFYLNNYASVVSPCIIDTGAYINNGLSFNSESFFNLFYCSHSFPSGFHVESGSEWLNRDSFIGIKFPIDGETHYGWVRVGLSVVPGSYFPSFVIKDYAYNATANAGLSTELHEASVPYNLTLSDIGELNNGTDLQLFFTKAASENTVSEYRAFLYKGFPAPNIEELEALGPDLYTAILPDGEDVNITFSEETRDTDGDLIAPDVHYRCFVLSKADGVLVDKDELSVVSSVGQFSLLNAPSLNLSLSNNFSQLNSNSFKVSFSVSQTSMDSLRVYLADKNTYSLDTLLDLPREYFVYGNVEPGSQTIHFPPEYTIYDNIPVAYKRYYAYAITLPDHILTSFPTMSVSYGRPLMVKYLPIAPDVSLVDNTDGTTQIKIEFPKVYDESLITEYRIYIVPAEEGLWVEQLPDLLAFTYSQWLPSGMDMDKRISTHVHDIHNQVLVPDKLYRIYVGVKNENYLPFTLSMPSDPFSFTQFDDVHALPGTISEDLMILISNDYCDIQNWKKGPCVFRMTDMLGRIILEGNISSGHVRIPLPNLAGGTYIVQLQGMDWEYTEKIYIP